MAKRTVKKDAKKAKAKKAADEVFEEPDGPKMAAAKKSLQAAHDDIEMKAGVLDEIVQMSEQVTKLENEYVIAKDDCLQKKKAFDSAEKKLRERIKRIQQEESNPNLFNGGGSGEVDDEDKEDAESDEILV